MCINDLTIKGWMFKTRELDMLELFLDLSMAKDICDSIALMYYDALDEFQIYELRCKATQIRQDSHHVSVYFTEIKVVWLELDRRRPIKMQYPTDVKTR